ncbi:hypothetical protein [Bradyrhizobium sp.]|uniref:hypothetical protein n=1 Tax=Bradyrhizobium sp. TaxID=376 RepID=UPI0023A55A06|nr:hypothetical protein [Bradyrhizobium sp.]MDE2380175.1 hypothetical protein [Bradyrhizobium sp.]
MNVFSRSTAMGLGAENRGGAVAEDPDCVWADGDASYGCDSGVLAADARRDWAGLRALRATNAPMAFDAANQRERAEAS